MGGGGVNGNGSGSSPGDGAGAGAGAGPPLSRQNSNSQIRNRYVVDPYNTFNTSGGGGGRGLHSFRFQLNLSSSVHRVTQLLMNVSWSCSC